MDQEQELITNILGSTWLDVKAMVAPEVPNVLLDVVFKTANRQSVLTGKAHLLHDDSEAFSLAVHEYSKRGWWEENDAGETSWKPRHLSQEWEHQSIGLLLATPREIRFYYDPRLKDRRFPAQFWLDSCSAIEFSRTLDGVTKRLVFAASNDYPYALEMGMMHPQCDFLLAGLEELKQ